MQKNTNDERVSRALETRKRLRDDFEFYAKNCIKIRTKGGEIIPFVLNGPQRRLLEVIDGQIAATGKVRVIILKARQQGFSTFVHAYLYWQLSQQKAKKGLVVAHVAESTRALFDMYRRTHDLCPEFVKPSTKYSSRRELSFSGLDTSLIVATAGGDAIARGETLTHVHLSEVGLWPAATAADNMAGLLKCIPNSKDSVSILESTAHGMSGPFYDIWTQAVQGKNEYMPFFSPWFDSPEYVAPVPNGFERTYEEEDLVAKYGLSDEQLVFRRHDIANSSREQFMQDYPSNAEEAFITSGRPVFNPEQIYSMLSDAPEPEYRMLHAGSSFEKNVRGELKVYHERELNERYYIGADVAMGVKGGDFSVAQVLDSQKRQVAVWWGHVHPDYFANILHDLGMYYNEARLVVENNNHGILTAVRLGRDLAYPNIYTAIGEGQLNDKESMVIGFNTNGKTKPLIIDRLRAALREDEMEINDKTTLKEMLSFIVTESGKMEAEADLHDDCVMSLALANHIHDGKFTPIAVSDDFYTNAI